MAQRRAQKKYEDQIVEGKNEEIFPAKTLQKNGLLKAELSQYGYEAFLREL